MHTRRMRVARGLVAAALATFAAASSHGIAGGVMPSLFALLIAASAAVFVCIALAGRALSLWRLSISVVLSQAAFHLLFTLVPAANGTVLSGAHGEHTMPGGATMLQLDAVVPAAHGHPGDAVMWAGHAVAAVVTIVALRRGERAFWGLFSTLRLCALALFGALLAIVPVRRTVPVAPDRLDLPAFAGIFLSPMRRRGPPAIA